MITVKNKGIFFLLLGLCLLLLSSCHIGDTIPPAPDAKGGKSGTTEFIVPGAKAEETDEQQEDEKKQDTEKVEKAEGKKAVQKPFWQSEASKLYEALTATAAAAQQDYKMNGAKRGWMSKNGKLYNYYDGSYITPAVLVKDGYLEEELDTEGFELWLVNGEDLAAYSGISTDSMSFQVFAAVKQNGKYLLASADGKAGQLSQEDYQSLWLQYNQNHGASGRLSSATAEYGRILNYISLYEGRFSDYYVREIRKDNKYAVVVFSTTSNTANIKEYILKNDNGFWEVVYPNVQLDVYPITAINRTLPDFNPDVLPKYNLAAWQGLLKAEQGGAVAAMFAKRYIASRTQIQYQCATASCAYFRLTDGSRYVAYSNGEYWTAEAVSSDIAARNYFKERMGGDYSFIILDD